jgi:hypothetical protein
MAPAEDADITPFGMSLAGDEPPLALQPAGDVPDYQFEIEPSPQPMS